jgi:hypothetical protein
MSAALAARWESACTRLGVKPRQFAVLLSVTAVAVAALAARTALRPARAAKAPQAAPAPAPAEAPERAPAAERLPVVELALESQPARDPFRPFFLLADAAPDSAPRAGGSQGAVAAAAPSGLSLRAAIAGELAVVGEQTVGIGDELVDDSGRRFTVEEIHERRVVLREGMRRTELGYARTAAKAAPKGGRK